jgi:hypothetical protein
MIPVLERVKTLHALDRAATVIGDVVTYQQANTAPVCEGWLVLELFTDPVPIAGIMCCRRRYEEFYIYLEGW